MSDPASGPWAPRPEPQPPEPDPPDPPAGESAISGRFTGDRTQLFGILLRGYLLLVPTLGIYRFWLITQKRRFYWSRTRLGPDALEYTGTAAEILFGFLIAIAIFLPFYVFFFYISTQSETVALIGLSGGLLALFLLSGFALFRSRRYRLTRTLWRGIRFHQTGSAWQYAFMRVGWYLLTAITAGLVYPFMSASLFRYRYANTWYGDRRLGFTGSWRQIAGPYYTMWVLLVGTGGAALYASLSGQFGGPATAGLASVAIAVLALLAIPYITARERTRFTSRVSIGEATISLHVRARALIGMYVVYALVLAAALLIAVGIVSQLAFGTVVVSGDLGLDPEAILKIFERSGVLTVLMFVAGYLSVIAILSLVAELFLGLTFWRMVVRKLVIANPGSLDTVQAQGAESRAIGEGIADALGSGGY